jgi:hypothetical protein
MHSVRWTHGYPDDVAILADERLERTLRGASPEQIERAVERAIPWLGRRLERNERQIAEIREREALRA